MTCLSFFPSMMLYKVFVNKLIELINRHFWPVLAQKKMACFTSKSYMHKFLFLFILWIIAVFFSTNTFLSRSLRVISSSRKKAKNNQINKIWLSRSATMFLLFVNLLLNIGKVNKRLRQVTAKRVFFPLLISGLSQLQRKSLCRKEWTRFLSAFFFPSNKNINQFLRK